MTQRINKWINGSIYEFYLSVSNPIWILFSLSHLWSFIYGNEYFPNLQSQKLETTWSYSPINGWLPGKSRSLKEINNEYGILPGAFCLLEVISNSKWLAQLVTMARRRWNNLVSRLCAQATLLTLGLWFLFAPAPKDEAVTWVSCRDTWRGSLRGKISYLAKISHGQGFTRQLLSYDQPQMWKLIGI